MKESWKKVDFLRVLYSILTIIAHRKNQELSRGKSFHPNLVHRIVKHGEKHTPNLAVVSMAHESLRQGTVNS